MKQWFKLLVVSVIAVTVVMLFSSSILAAPRPSPSPTPTPTILPTPVPGLTTVCIWKDNKIAAFTPTYDDGLWDSIVQIDPIQTKYGITGSLCIPTQEFNTLNGIHWVDLKAMAQRGVFDLNSHTNTHLHLIKATAAEMDAEFEVSNNMIYSNTGFKAEAIADPYNETNAAVKVEEAKYYVCARQGNFSATFPVYPETNDYYGLYAYVFGRDNLATMQSWVDYGVTNGTWCIINFHGVGNDGWQPCPLADLDGLFAYVASKSNQIWNAGLPAVGKYIRERQTSTITIQSNTATQIILALTNTLVDNYWYSFNQPLTLKTCVPGNWTSATITQGATRVTKPVVTEGAYRFIYYDALPNQGPVTLTGI